MKTTSTTMVISTKMTRKHEGTSRRPAPQPEEMNSMMHAFLKGLQLWVQTNADSDVRVPAGAMASRDELAKTICRILQTETRRIPR